MRAARITTLDGPQTIKICEGVLDPLEDPTAAESVIIEVYAAGVAFPDALLSRGLYQYRPELPFTPGAELSGVVVRAPQGSTFSPGDRVLAITGLGGAIAEKVAVPSQLVFALPEQLSMTAAAGILFNDLTVHFALTIRGQLKQGETVLVHGGAGGIGTSVLRMAPALGAARTIAVVSTGGKAEIAKAAGATEVVLADNWRAEVSALTNGKGVDVVVDPVGNAIGADRFTDSLRSLSLGGRILVLGFTAGEIPMVKVNRLLLNNVDVRGVGWGAWWMQKPERLEHQWRELEPYYIDGRISLPEPVVYSFEDTAQAILSLENRTAAGKVVVMIESS
ncbi:MAG: NADPH:quinone oxidoreductase family protein [Mycobacteriaceae bacterium]